MATAEVTRFVAVVRTELDAAGDDGRVAALIAETAAAALAELGEAVDAQLATGPEARQVATACTPLQVGVYTFNGLPRSQSRSQSR